MIAVLVMITIIVLIWGIVGIAEFGPRVLEKRREYKQEVGQYKNSDTLPKLPKGYHWRVITLDDGWPVSHTKHRRIIEMRIQNKDDKHLAIGEIEIAKDEPDPGERVAELVNTVYDKFRKVTDVDVGLDNALNYYKGIKPKSRKQDK